MRENLVVLIDFSQMVGKTTQTSKLLPLCSTLSDKYKLYVCYLVNLEESHENYQQLSKDLKSMTYSEHIVQAESNSKLLFLAKSYIDNMNFNDILILSLAISIPNWKALASILLTASAYRIRFESLDKEPLDEPVVEFNSIQDDCHKMLVNINAEEPVKILRSNIIPKDIFYHGFSTRLGGISSIQNLKSLNLYYTSAKRDPKVVIVENIRRLAKAGGFQPEKLQVAKVEHGNAVWEIGTIQPESYDAQITSESNITLAVPGADCLMLLFADPIKKICAAAHSGWKGTMLQVAKEVVQKMIHHGSNPKDIRVAVGPGVGGCCFPVCPEVGAMFEKSYPSCLIPLKNSGKVGLDLFKANHIILEENGILPENIDIETVSLCTVCNQEWFYSYKRDGKPFGNQMGYIGLCK